MSQYPVGHCSFPPRLRRLVHENLTALRFSVSFWFYIFNLSRKQNHVFVQRNPICNYFCLREEGENAAENAKAFEWRCRLEIAEIRRQQLAENFASNYLARLKTTFFKKRTQFVAYLRLERVNLRGINLRERAKKPRKEGRALRSRFSAATLLRGKRE